MIALCRGVIGTLAGRASRCLGVFGVFGVLSWILSMDSTAHVS